ncbi:phosphatidylserine/phosphatidylglycerophosphate/cardiolipin synthase family protein [Georgenia thermotolerans]|uniref:phospholipase D n=2 Tax=Georgenia thermotolerans TaxID=527326 RepID=A0A7J5UQ27_9MICO|nr:phosphatidylserine/phosphatidylglycerophosphate/cardiolipin synthase family protein [Georgenia thermotolerans]
MPRLAGLAAAALVALPVVAATTPATAAAANPATACADAPLTPVTPGAAFNNPAAGRATGVVEQICSLVKQAPQGSQIRLAHFVISGAAGMDFADVLLAARDRGVDVQVVLDGWQVDNPASVALIEALGQDTSAGSWVHVCGNVSPEGNTSSCIGTKGQHNKFYLFSETGGAKNVVVQSSANFTDVNSRTYWNNAVVLPGNHRLYDAYNAYFEDLAAEVQDPDYYRQVTTAGPGGPVTAHFFPSADADPVLERLNELGCKRDGATEVRVGMSEWDATRLGIADRLVEMAEDGCAVRVVHGPMVQEVADTFAAAGIDLRALNSGTLPGRIHSKYLIVDGATGTRSGGQIILTGSPNFNTTSLHRNDEAMLELRDKAIYEQYEENFETMWAAAARG